MVQAVEKEQICLVYRLMIRLEPTPTFPYTLQHLLVE